MDGRQQRGLQIAASGQVSGLGHAWQVPSQRSAGKRPYRVNPYAGSCTCPDHQEMHIRCKHLWAVIVTMDVESTPEGTTVTQTTRITYRQKWSSYNRAQVEEKDTFMRLLADLCRDVPQPEQMRGRPRLPMSDMAFAAAFKVYSRFSSRRFSSDLREACERGLIQRAPHFNSVSNYLSSPDLTPVLHDLITESSLPLRALESDFAADSSGFTTSRFVRWLDTKHGGGIVEKQQREWVKAHLMVGVRTNVVTAIEVSDWRDNDSRYFPHLVEATAENFEMAEVSADKAYLSKRNVALVEEAGAIPYIPFKSTTAPMLPWTDSPWARMYHLFAYNREEFLRNYHKRSNVETAFAMIKAKFGDAVLSKSPMGMANEVLAKVLCHNVVVVGQAIHEFGVDPSCFSSAQELSA